MTLKNWSALLLAAALAALATACSETTTAETKEEAAIVGARPVRTAVVALRDFRPRLEATGTLMPVRHAELRTLVEGRLDSVPFDIGTRVRKGQVVFETRAVDYRLALQQAEAAVSQARAALAEAERERKRLEGLAREGSATEQARDQAVSAHQRAEAGLLEAEARRDAAAQKLDDCTVAAPYDGVVTRRILQRGEFAPLGEPVVELVDLSTLHAELEIPERFVGQIVSGQEAALAVRATGREVTGRVVAINPSIDERNRTFVVKVEVANAGLELQAGLFVAARFELPPLQGVPAVPAAALIRDEGRSTVWVVENGKARSQVVHEGEAADGWVQIEGLAAGQSVVAGGAGGLVDGSEVVASDAL